MGMSEPEADPELPVVTATGVVAPARFVAPLPPVDAATDAPEARVEDVVAVVAVDAVFAPVAVEPAAAAFDVAAPVAVVPSAALEVVAPVAVVASVDAVEAVVDVSDAAESKT